MRNDRQQAAIENKHDRAMCVRLPLSSHRAVRTIAVTQDMTNAEVLGWAIELLDRHVREGGSR